MKKLVLGVSLLCFLSSSSILAGPINSLTKKEKKQGWKLLFDGKTTSGWRNYNKPTLSPIWKVEDDALFLSDKKGGDIVTLDEYENFELSIDWKISEAGNSGIFYLVHEDSTLKAPYHSGIEYQILDNDKHSDNKKENHLAASNYDLITTTNKKTKPVGEYNEAKIVVNKGKVEHWLNGEKVVEYVLWSPEWEELVAKSKFSKMKAYGRSHKGHISLQDHGDKVWFRNIKIRELK